MRPNHGAVPASPRDAAVPPSPQDTAPAPGLSSPAAARALAVLPSSCEGRILPRFPAASPRGATGPIPVPVPSPGRGSSPASPGVPPPAPRLPQLEQEIKEPPVTSSTRGSLENLHFPPVQLWGLETFIFLYLREKFFAFPPPPDQTSCGLAQAGDGAQAALGGPEIFCRVPGPVVGRGHSCVSQNELGGLRGAGSEARAPRGCGSSAQHHPPPAPCAMQGTRTGIFGTGNIWGVAGGAGGSCRAHDPHAQGGCRAQHPLSTPPAPVAPSPPLPCRVSLCEFTD